VVDDEIDARDLVAAVLGKCGANVRVASTVDEAIARIRERRPDVLLSDIGFPGDDGYELIRRVHEIDPAIPAAALTAYATPQDVRRAIEAGFQAHVAKPVEPSDLGLLVASLSGRIVAPPTVEPARPPRSRRSPRLLPGRCCLDSARERESHWASRCSGRIWRRGSCRSRAWRARSRTRTMRRWRSCGAFPSSPRTASTIRCFPSSWAGICAPRSRRSASTSSGTSTRWSTW